MNSHLYRIVFNHALGLCQVVSELVRRPGQGASSTDGRRTTHVRAVSWGLWVAFGWIGLTSAAHAGRIVGDPNAPGNQRPTVLGAQGTAPLINIQTPSAAGVSRNTYSQFDVDAAGAVLNNSRTATTTQLAGSVAGNPWLATGTASIILNEVTGPNPSALNGYIEVAGDRAQVIIANPAGISCDGCGVINANHFTLTTGTPVINGGALDSYRVTGGTVSVTGAGLDASQADYADIIARSVQVNAGIWAPQLQVTTGSNQVSADVSQITPIAGSGTVPTLALDVSALGGMYANKIVLIGNEDGVGVRNAGTIGAQAGDLVVTVDGRLENTGHLQSQADTTLAASGGVTNAGTISATGTLSLTTPQDVDNSGGTLTAGRLALDAASLRNAGGTITQTGPQAIALQAGTLSNQNGVIGLPVADTPATGDAASAPTTSTTPDTGSDANATGGGASVPSATAPLADGVLHVAGLLDNDGGQIRATSGFDLATTNGLSNDGGQLTLRQLTVNGGDLSNAGGTLSIDGAATIHANNVTNDTGQLIVNGPLTFTAGQFNNHGGTFDQLDTGATSLAVTGTLDNTDGTLASNAASLSLTSGTLINVGGTITHGGLDGLRIATGDLYGAGGRIATAGSVWLTAGTVDHQNATLSATQVTVNATAFDNRGGTISASGPDANTLSVTGTLDNGDGGTLASNGDLAIHAATFGNAGGTVQHAGQGALTLDVASLHGAGGTIQSNGTLTITGNTTDLSGGTTEAQHVAITTGTLSTAHGTLTASASDPLVLHVSGAYDNTQGTVITNGAMQLQAGSLDNTGGTLTAAGTAPTQVTVTGALTNTGGTLGAMGATTVHASSLLNEGGTVQAAGGAPLTVTVDGLLDNSAQGSLGSDGDLSLTASTLNNAQGTITHAGTGVLTIAATTLTGHGGTIGSNGALTLTGTTTDLSGGTTQAHSIAITTGTLSTAGGQVTALGDDPLQFTVGGAFDNTGGTIEGNGDLALTAGSVSNHGGTLQATGAVDATVSGTLDNAGGALIANGDLTVHAATLLNHDTPPAGAAAANVGLYGQTVTVDTTTLDNSHGTVVAQDALQVSGTTLTNVGGVLDGQGTVTVTGGSLDNSGDGKLTQHGDAGQLTVTLTQGLTNGGGGAIGAEGSAQVQAGTIDNRGGSIEAVHDLQLTSGGDLSNANGGKVQTGGALTLSAVGAFDNSAGDVDATGAATIHAATITNTDGQLIAGQATTPDASLQLVASGALSNRGGTIGSRGGDVVVQTASFDNGAGGTLSAQRDANLDQVGTLSNVGGTVSAVRNLSDQNAAGTIDNTNGVLGSDDTTTLNVAQLTNTNGHLLANTLALTTPTLNNSGGEIKGNTVHATLGALNGIGLLSGAALLDAHFTGDYTHLAGQELQSDGVLKLTVDGTMTNQGTLQSAGELDLTAGNLVNTNGATINGSNSTHTGVANVTVAGSLDNQQGATLEGDTLTVTANSLTNTGNIDGDTVTANAANLTNGRDLGTAAAAVNYGEGFIGAADGLALHVGNLSNLDGELYSGGDMTIAADAAGNPAATVLNSSGLIQAGGNLTISAQQITNQLRYFTTKDVSLTTAEQAQNTNITDEAIFRSDSIDPGTIAPSDTPPAQILDASQIAILEAYCGGSDFGTPGKDGAQWCRGYQPDPDNDPHTIFADDLKATVTKTLLSVNVLDFATAASVMMAGGDVNLTGTVLNVNSQFAAGHNLTIGDPTTGQTGMSAVTNQSWVPTGQVRDSTDQQIGIWHIGGGHTWELQGYNSWEPVTTSTETVNLLGDSAPAWITYDAGPGLASSITAGGTINITAATLTNTDVGGPTMGPLTGPGSTTMAATTGAFASNASSGSGQTLTGPGAANGAGKQTVGNTGKPLAGMTPPSNALVQQHTEANAPFLLTTAPRFAQGPVTSSNYLLQALGDDPANMQKRLGDGYVEQNQVMDQILQLTGRQSLTGSGDAMTQYTDLMRDAAQQAAQLGLTLGAPLTTSQIAGLQSDIVWLVDTVVDGQHVLSPVVYLSQATADALKNQGALIAGDQVDVQAGLTLTNNGLISSDNGTSLSADALINTGALQSSGTLAIATRGDVVNAGTTTAQGVSVQAGRDLVNTGAVTASGNALLQAGRDLTTNAAPIKAGGNLAMVAGHNLTATASSIQAGGNAQLSAGNDLTLAAQSHVTRSEVVAGKTTPEHGETTVSYATTGVSAGGNLVLEAGNNLTSNGGQLSAGNQLGLVAGNDIALNAVTDRTTTTSLDVQKHTVTSTATTDETVKGTGLTGANGVTVIAQHDLSATAATLSSANGAVSLAAGNDLNLDTAQENHSKSVDTKTTSGGMLSSKTTRTHDSVSDSDVVGTSVVGNAVTLSAGHNLTAQAAQLQAADALKLSAGNDIALTTGQDVHTEEHDTSVTKSGAMLGGAGELTYQGSKTTNTQSTQQSDAIGTTLSGDTVTVGAGHDLTAAAAQIAGTGDVTLAAANNLTLTTADSTYDASSSQSKKTSGFMRSGIDVTIGVAKQGQSDSLHQVTPTGTLVGSSDGNLTLSAGNNVLIHGSDLLGQAGTTIVGSNVTIDAAVGSTDSTQKESQSTTGVTAGLGGVAGNLAHAVYGAQQTISHTDDPRLKALAAAQAAYQVKDDIAAMGDASASAAQGGAVNIQVQLGASHASSSTVIHDDTAYGSQVHSGGDVTIAALGDGTAGSGNLSVIGSQVAGDNVTLAAANNLLLQSQAEQHSMVSRNENSSGGVGVSFGTDGLGIYAQASVGQGDAHGNGTTHAQTDVTATDKLALISGNNTTIAGAQATGNSVLASIGGNLNLVSDQDTDDYASKTIQAGAKVMVGITQSGFVSGSGYISQGKVKSTYTSVNDISGIGAGTGGYNITVGGNTDLNGAVITSTADAAKNVLDTGTLSFENLHNVSEYDAKQTTVSGGSTVSSNVMGAIGTGLSLAVPQGDNSSSDTKAGIAQGTITVRDNPDQDLTGLDRNPTLDNQALKNSFDLQKVQDNQQVGQLAGQLAMEVAGDVAQSKTEAYRDAVTQAGLDGQTLEAVGLLSQDGEAAIKTDQANQQSIIGADQSTYDTWGPGGIGEIAMHAGAGALAAGLGGGNAWQGAVGAAAGEAATPWLVNNLGRNSVLVSSALVGGLAGGGAGAATADMGTQYNYLSHAEIDDLNAVLAACTTDACRKDAIQAAKQQSIQNDVALGMLCGDGGSVACYQGIGALESYEDSPVVPSALHADQVRDGKLEQTSYFGDIGFFGGVASSLYSVLPQYGEKANFVAGVGEGIEHFPGSANEQSNPDNPFAPKQLGGAGPQFTDGMTAAEAQGTVGGKAVQTVGLVVLGNEGGAASAVAADEWDASQAQALGTSTKSALADGTATGANKVSSPGIASAVADEEASGDAPLGGAAADAFFNRTAQAATQNPGGNEVILGPFAAGSPTSYDAVAQARGATYFSMNNWTTISGEIGSDQMWGINRAFLDQQIAQGKTFTLTTDPALVQPSTYTGREIQYLSSKGFNFIRDAGGTYRAVK